MLRKGQSVTTLTSKVGAPLRHGRVIAVHDDLVDVEWEDGHISTLTKESVVPEERDKASSNH